MDVGGQDQGEGELTEDYRRDKFDATLDTKLFDELLLWADRLLAQVEATLDTNADWRQRTTSERRTCCEQSVHSDCRWCPVCALATALRGEQHELVAVCAATVSAASRDLLDGLLGGGLMGRARRTRRGADDTATEPDVSAARQPRRSAFIPINVTVPR